MIRAMCGLVVGAVLWAAVPADAAPPVEAYGKLPAKKPDGSYELPPDYVTDAIEAMRLQLARAGVRLAAVLNHAFAAKR